MIPDRFTKAVLTVIAICLCVLSVHTFLEPGTTVHGAADSLQFSADKDHIYFFDPLTHKVYTYLVIGGHTQNILQFSTVGADLSSAPLH